MKKALAEIEALTAALSQIGKGIAGLADTLDGLTKTHTQFFTFSSLVHAVGRPVIPKVADGCVAANDALKQYFAELDLLALAYDMAQQARNDPRRAFRS